MTEQWSIIDFKELMKSLLHGNRSIQEPISISNKRRDTVSKISFLNLLLSYNNVTKDNLLDVLANIYGRFQYRINELKENQIVSTMMDTINQEWYDPNYIFIIEYPFSDDFFDKNTQNKPKHTRCCKVCEEIKHLSTIENNIPLKIEKDGVHPLDKHFTTGIGMCKETIDYIETNLSQIDLIIQSMKNSNMSQFIDLSIKHKALYLKLSNKDENDDSIPENIHHIFSNYYHVHNLLLKQLIQYYHYNKNLLDELKEKCQSMETLQQNVNTIAYFDEDDDDNDDNDDYDNNDDGDDTLSVEDGEVYHTAEKEGGDNLVEKVLSFF